MVPDPNSVAGLQAGASAPLFSAQDDRRDPLCGAQRMHLANDAARVSSLETGLLLFFQVARPGGLGENQSGLGGEGASATLKKKAPTAAIIDSQSVEMSSQQGRAWL